MSQIHSPRKPIISVRVLFFGVVAHLVGCGHREMELFDGATVGDLHAGLLSEHPDLEGVRVLYAVDQQYCSGRHMLADAEEVAFFTPVSGG